MSNQSISVHPANAPAIAPIPVGNAQFIVDEAALDQQLHHRPGFFAGWNGAATAGGSLVAATQNQYTFSGGLGIVRIVPTVTWLRPQNRTSAAFTGSFGKITEPAYTIPATPVSPPVFVPEVTTKSALYHAEAERDEYFSPRFYGLVQIAYDHNYAQNLDLQQIYGGGFGWTFLKTPKQEADVKGTIQYERRSFISGGPRRQPDRLDIRPGLRASRKVHDLYPGHCFHPRLQRPEQVFGQRDKHLRISCRTRTSAFQWERSTVT